jgi:hypothetical protein
MKPDPQAPRIETRRTVRRGERTMDVRVVEYPAAAAGRRAGPLGRALTGLAPQRGARRKATTGIEPVCKALQASA